MCEMVTVTKGTVTVPKQTPKLVEEPSGELRVSCVNKDAGPLLPGDCTTY